MKSGLFHCSIRQLRRADSTKSGRAASAARHYDYILRRGDYSPPKLAKARRKTEKEERLIFCGDFSIPSWGRDSKNDALKFWMMADEFERANARLALKIEVAIPRGVLREKWQDLIEEFARKQFRNHPCSFAIHEGRAADGGTNPHGHFEVSERRLDGIQRSAELFFRRANPSHPELGGAAKDRAWHDKDFFRRVRKSWADTCNKFLAETNVETRVDHRSYASRGIQKEAGTHDGPHRRAMRARGVPARPRSAETRRAELRRINDQIRDLQFQKANEVQIMKSKPIVSDREAAAAVARGRIYLNNTPLHDPAITIEGVELGVTPVPNEFGARIHKAFRERGWQIEWLHAATKPGQLPSFRARHPLGFEIEFRPGLATATSSSDEAVKALVFTCKQAGWKSVALSGTKDARRRMEVACKAAGIRVTNPLTVESVGAAPSPAVVVDDHLYLDEPQPPPSQLTKPKPKPKPKPTKKARDEIFRRVDDQIFQRSPVTESVSDKAYEFSHRDLRYTPKSAEWRCDGRDLYTFAREMAAKNFDRYFIKSPNDKNGKGFERLLFCMACDRGVDPERLRLADGLPIRHPPQRLRLAIKNFYAELDEPIPELVAAWLENRQPKAEAKTRPSEHATIPLEPEPE